MKLAFLGSSTSWYFEDLQRAAGDSQLTAFSFNEIHASLADTKSLVFLRDQSATDFDAVLVRVMPPGSLEQVVFRMDALQEIANSGVLVLNSPKSIEAAVDKYLCLAKLARAGLWVPPTKVCHSLEQALDEFDEFERDVLVKPIFGGEGRGIVRINDKDLLYRTLRAIENFQGTIYLQKFIANQGYDLRLMVLGDEIFSMRRENQHHWKTNISSGGTGLPHEPTDEECRIARQASSAVDAEFAGVDLLVGDDGKTYVVEVNAVPGWRALSRVTGIDVAQKLIDYVAQNI